jgi:hypothetical protein
MTEQRDLEEKLARNERELARLQAARASERETFEAFGFLRTEWFRAIENGTVDWADLIARLEAALAAAKERSHD